MNTLAITVSLTLEENLEDAYLDFQLTVDGQYLHDSQNHWVDPVDLVTSVTATGEFFLFTCSCGDPECVGIDKGVEVRHEERQVIWLLRNPLGWPSGEELPEWAATVELHFDHNEYSQVVRSALGQAKTLLRHWQAPGNIWVGPDLSTDELLGLEVGEGVVGNIVANDTLVH